MLAGKAFREGRDALPLLLVDLLSLPLASVRLSGSYADGTLLQNGGRGLRGTLHGGGIRARRALRRRRRCGIRTLFDQCYMSIDRNGFIRVHENLAQATRDG
jgi:hypothetical protein